MKKLIMLVDDDLDYVKLFSHLLSAEGYDVLCYGSSSDALAYLESNSKMPDLILSDIMMPAHDGLEFLKVLKSNERTKNISICILSAYSNEKVLYDAFQLGANDYILKTQNKVCLLERINQNIITPKKSSECYIALLEVTDVISDFKIANFDEKRIELITSSELPINAQIKIKSRSLRPYTGNSDQLDCIVDQCQLEDEQVRIICRHKLKAA
ncbi:response regulator [Halobacteriovorax sp. GB3]|uniref:response regulator n=1 Tax=Halobacteriovorax sp. GB3 TaxID=2719615 RepID=UPI0023613452|nr:response regulator [Halobacteriovorax sp. GB3]MDD0852961.1 response regulator [Halobacteriovorax sp. GB3]